MDQQPCALHAAHCCGARSAARCRGRAGRVLPTAGGVRHRSKLPRLALALRRYCARMGLPFNEGMVRQHYQRMRVAFEEGGPAAAAAMMRA